MNERKRVWNRWKDNVVREERDAARQKAIEARQDFKQVLLVMADNVTSTTVVLNYSAKKLCKRFVSVSAIRTNTFEAY